MVTYLGPIWWTKHRVDSHRIDSSKCIQCGTCAEKCPVDAIDPFENRVDTLKCVLCFGCVNSCPARAVIMESDGKPLVGFFDLMAQYGLNPDLKS